MSKANAKFSPTPGGPTPAQICTPNPAQNGVRGMAVARGAVAENSVLVQFLCCGARKKFRRRQPPSWPGRQCPAGRPALRAGSPRSSRRVPGTSAERSSLPGGPPQLPSARMTCACVLVPMTKHASTLLTGPDRGAGAQGATAGYELLRRAAGRQGGLYGNFDIMFDRFSRICQLDTVRFNQSDNNTPRVCGRFGWKARVESLAAGLL